MDSNPLLHRLSAREQLVLSVLWLPINVVTAALLPIVLPTQILLFVAPGQIASAQQAAFLGALSTLGALLSLFIPPIVGLLSDHTKGSLGRRRPYIIAGAICVLLSVPFVSRAVNIVIFVFGLAILQVGINVVTAAYQSLTPDLILKEQRGEASGYMGLMTILGNVGSLALAAWLFGQVSLRSAAQSSIQNGVNIYYTVTALVLLLGVCVTVLGVHELPFSAEQTEMNIAQSLRGANFRTWFVRNWVAPWHEFNFTLVFLTRFSVMMGLALFMTFVEYYFAEVAHVTNFVQETAALAVLALVGAIISAFSLGILSDHVKRAPLVSGATICMALASLAFVLFTNTFPLWPLGILFGVGYGAYTSVDWALSVDSLPSMDTVGKDLGLWSASMTLPAIVAPLVGSGMIAVAHLYASTSLGYRLVFALATFFLVLAAVLILLVRERSSDARVAPSARRTKRAVGFGWRLAFQTRAGRARGFLLFWLFWEWLMRTLWHIQPIPNAPHHVVEVRFMRYNGRPIDLPDGTHVQVGDPIIELHFRNRAFLELAGDGKEKAWEYMRMISQNFQALARWMQESDFPSQAQAIYGVTLLSRGAPRLGFTLRERPRGLHTQLERFFMTGLLVLYSPEGRTRLERGTTYGTYPQEAWMSRSELLKRYGSSH
jgi:MFS family permease